MDNRVATVFIKTLWILRKIEKLWAKHIGFVKIK